LYSIQFSLAILLPLIIQFFAIPICLRTFFAICETLVHVGLLAGFLSDLEGTFIFFGFSATLDESLVVEFYAF
jgi:hypothetical protein